MSFLSATLGNGLTQKIHESKILVVGAGGIGCELLKNLVLSGFENITIVDLDTIDVSNLNRQFLFRSHHVGQSKAIVAREVALQFNPKAKITAYHENIKTSRYSIEYIEQFVLVLNALDNVDARKHVNRLCLAANVPLIESGTTGYLGQVSVIKKGETECYECTEKATAKVYPICTIRSTPDKMVHCIVWAKECYKLLFGKTEDSMLWEDPSNEDKSAFMDHVLARDLAPSEYAQGVFRGLFEYEIQKKLDIKTYKTASKMPSPIKWQDLSLPPPSTSTTWNDRMLWSLEECVQNFLDTIITIVQSNDDIGHLEFDKDDSHAMTFVAAAANLRAHVFQIPMESLFACKGIAGNIIPAIATTNAIVAGLQVLEAFKIIRLQLEAKGSIATDCKYTYCNRSWDGRGVVLNPVALSHPNPKCFVCSRQMLDLALDIKTTTLHQVVEHVLKKRMGMNAPTVSIGSNTIYEEGEDAEESLVVNLPKLLHELPGGGLHHDTVLTVEDFSQDFNCSLCVKQWTDTEKDENATLSFLLGHEYTKWKQDLAQPTTDAVADMELVDDELEVVQHEKRRVPSPAKSPRSKRMRH
ncbi:ubiquitin-activating enzyme (E1) [Thraustotheca clavata]|uniref:SUMO-activating enzyme subunit n=1 Tax=Thraustotheca clavata TaxID=74557 RepID=A0A1W0A8R5_9STRA|nr:ubiquitin-activating enzyme (E1) [Thraustotheca clavata]